MNTKVLYVIVCDNNHNYIEQAAVSAYSVKHYSPSASITLLVDDMTNKEIEKRSLIKRLVSEIIVVPIPSDYNNKMKSRFIKTTARKIVKGDYLFIDTDTVVCRDLSIIDNYNVEVGAVKDLHVSLDKTNYLEMVSSQANIMGWSLCEKDYQYYNSGVMLVKDTPLAHKLYDNWNRNWTIKAQKGFYTDQPALAFANYQCHYVIKELPGYWNCQLFVNGLPFLSEAYIIHYFSSGVNKKSKVSPFYFLNPNLLESIKQNQKFPNDFQDYINNPKEKAFPIGKTKILSGEDYDVFNTDVVNFIFSQYYYYPRNFKLIEKFVSFYNWIKKLIK